MTFWYESGSADASFDKRIRIRLRILLFSSVTFNTATKNFFFAYYFVKLHLHHFSNIYSHKESQNSRNQGFSYYFCLMIEGSGSGPHTNGSGWPKTIGIRIQFTIRNTSSKYRECIQIGKYPSKHFPGILNMELNN
jgi:hypothetical protein